MIAFTFNDRVGLMISPRCFALNFNICCLVAFLLPW